MKRISFIFILAIIFLSACAAKKADESIAQAGKDVVSIADNFLDKKITAKVASEKIDLLSESIESIDFSDIRNPNGEIYTQIAELSFKLESVPESGDDDGDTVLAARNTLAESVGVPYRSKKSTSESYSSTVVSTEDESETTT